MVHPLDVDVDRLLQLLSHAVKEADSWCYEARGTNIEGDELIEEARNILMMHEID